MDKVVALKKAIALCKQENCVCAVWEEGGVIATFRGSLSTVSLFGLVHVVFFSRAAGREFKKVEIGGVDFSAKLVHASHGCAWWDDFFFSSKARVASSLFVKCFFFLMCVKKTILFVCCKI